MKKSGDEEREAESWANSSCGFGEGAGGSSGVRSSCGSRRKIELRGLRARGELRVSGARRASGLRREVESRFFSFPWASSEKSRSFRAERICKIKLSAVREARNELRFFF
ncbi:hypothetical protein CDL15_Pgr028810 [Punica granatum]|uniref:Uncharacterized protein n=1 Tax=Punica granatum TaxID=22663 RepID=A0A218VYY3_PUNGR|nr:hypothetical protein CDL15_Pgr028810 [Punica granatum]